MKDNKSQTLLLHDTPTSISVTLPEQSFHSYKFNKVLAHLLPYRVFLNHN